MFQKIVLKNLSYYLSLNSTRLNRLVQKTEPNLYCYNFLEISEKAYDTYLYAMLHFPDHYKTHEMCKTFALKELLSDNIF